MPTWWKWIFLLGVVGGPACTQEPARALPNLVPNEVLRRDGGTPAREPRAPLRSWPPFPALLWFPPGAQYTSERLAQLKSLGIDGVHVDGTDSPEAVVRADLSFYAGDAPGKGTLHLRASVYETAVSESSSRTGPIRPNCFNDSQVRALQLEKLTRALDLQMPYAPLGIALEDEVSTTSGINPIDFCYCDWCARGLRSFLRRRYRSVESLRATWERPYVSFDNAVPERTSEVLTRNKDLVLEKMSFSSWNDHREFMDKSLAVSVRLLADAVRQRDPAMPVGVLGGQMTSAFGGSVWSALAPACTLLEVYPMAGAELMARSYAPSSCRFVSTVFLKGSDPIKASHDLFCIMCRGDDGAILFSNKDYYDETGQPTALARSLAEPLATIRRVRETMARFARDPGSIAILDSQESIRAGWLVDAAQDGDTFTRRLTSYEAAHGSSILARNGWLRLLGDLRIPHHFMASDEVERGTLRQTPPRVLILTRAMALSDHAIRELMAFSQRGGLLIADSHLAYFDENLHGRHVPAMDEFFSLSRDARPINLAELGRKPEVAAEFGLTLGERGVEELGPSSRATVILKKQGNGGCTLFLNLDLANYKSADPRVGRLRDLLGKWFKENGVGSDPTIETEGGAPAARVLAYHYQGGDGERLVAMCLEDAKAQPVQVRIRFRAATALDELVGGRTLPAAAEHTFELRPESAVVIKFRASDTP